MLYSGFEPCPFCGADAERFDIIELKSPEGYSDKAQLTCPCGARMAAKYRSVDYVLLHDDIYRRIEPCGALDVLRENWNRRICDARQPSREMPLLVAGHDDRVPEGPEGYGSLAL